jgi:mannose-6-phosphate isomerase
MTLYPLLFNSLLKPAPWGGEKLKEEFNKSSYLPNIGESWELSCVSGRVSIVENGPLAGRALDDILREYGPAVLGGKVFVRTGARLPLLFKLIDAAQNLSIQVHPGDTLAKARHNSSGKTEMWYVLWAEPGAKLSAGFKEEVKKQNYAALVETGAIAGKLAEYEVKPGDSFFIPAGIVHAIGAGLVVAEVQQASDVTYRLFDYNRPGPDGRPRQLHTHEALDAIDFTPRQDYKTHYAPQKNAAVNIAKCPYFTVNLLDIDEPLHRNLKERDSFAVYMCVEGAAILNSAGEEVKLDKGRTALVPASIADIRIETAAAKLLEVYI